MYLFDSEGSSKFITSVVDEYAEEKDVKALMVLSADANDLDFDLINTTIKKSKIPVFGGIFPQIICESKNYEKGTVIVPMRDNDFSPVIIENLSTKTNEEIDDILFCLDISAYKTAFVFVDGLATKIEPMIESLFNVHGLEVNYIGGGAGSLSFEKKPCVFTNKGVLDDAAVIVFSTVEVNLGVSHGWKPISEPLWITESEKNKIISIDHKPAFEVYKSYVEKLSNKKFDDDNFFSIAKAYPFGLQISESEVVVRDPIKNEYNTLVCVGDVPKNSHVQILSGKTANLIEAASSAAKESQSKSKNNKFVFLIDCISRVLYLEGDFTTELTMIKDKELPMFGALTLGEIANSGKDFLLFYNKTCVVATGL